jgi:hypothetical protein
MLPTQSKSRIQVQRYETSKPILFLSPQENLPYGTIVPQHLYLTSNREIQSGDWVYYKLPLIETWGIGQFFGGNPDKTSLKVEATTDPSLKLPLIPQLFVKKYVQMQGKIEEVLIEMQMGEGKSVAGVEYWDPLDKPRVRTRPDGTVIIHRVKDSWTREEVSHLLTIAMVQMSDWKNEGKVTAQLDRLMRDWIKEQL